MSAILNRLISVGSIDYLKLWNLRSEGKIAHDSASEYSVVERFNTASFNTACKTIVLCSSPFTPQLSLILKLTNGTCFPQHRHYLTLFSSTNRAAEMKTDPYLLLPSPPKKKNNSTQTSNSEILDGQNCPHKMLAVTLHLLHWDLEKGVFVSWLSGY